MAKGRKRKSTRSSATVAPTSIGMRVVAVIVAIVLIAAAALVVLQFCTPYKPTSWFEKKPSNEGQSDGGLFDLSELDSKDIALLSEDIDFADYELYGVSRYALSSKILTAKVENIDATKLFAWSVRWQDAESAWAKGKKIANYVRVTVSSETTEKAVVECGAAFSEPVIIEVVLKANPNARATVVGNYVKELESATVGIESGVVTITNPVYSMLGQGTVEPELRYGLLIPGEDRAGICSIKLTDEFLSALEALGTPAIMESYDLIATPSIASKTFVLYMLGYSQAPESYHKQAYAAWITAAGECNVHAVLTVEVMAYYKGQLLSTDTFTSDVVFNVEALKAELGDVKVEIEGDGEVWFA